MRTRFDMVLLGLICAGADSHVLDHRGGAVRCADGACIEESRFLRIEGDAVVTGNNSTVTECEFRQCAGVAVTAGSACVIECCECVGGGPGGGGGGGAVGLRCADGCCVEDCTVINRNALAIECGSRCSVTCNQVVLCWGISCAAESCCCDNDLSSCSGGPDTSERTGGAIVIHGSSCTCEGNFVANCRVGISVQLDGSYCHVCDNIVTGAGAGSDPAAGVSAGILIHDGAAGCLCTCNHLRAVPGTPPYLLGTASHGPIVILASGDISALPGSSHPLANTATVI